MNLTIEPIFAWYDCWVGCYYDRVARALYVFAVPMIGLKISRVARADDSANEGINWDEISFDGRNADWQVTP